MVSITGDHFEDVATRPKRETKLPRTCLTTSHDLTNYKDENIEDMN